MMTTSKTLRQWEVRRSGNAMTVNGVDNQTGEATRITNVVDIKPPPNNALHEVIATDRQGTPHRLIYP